MANECGVCLETVVNTNGRFHCPTDCVDVLPQTVAEFYAIADGTCILTTFRQGSCTSLEFKAALEKSLHFK